jgi:hypothetical protein
MTSKPIKKVINQSFIGVRVCRNQLAMFLVLIKKKKKKKKSHMHGLGNPLPSLNAFVIPKYWLHVSFRLAGIGGFCPISCLIALLRCEGSDHGRGAGCFQLENSSYQG